MVTPGDSGRNERPPTTERSIAPSLLPAVLPPRELVPIDGTPPRAAPVDVVLGLVSGVLAGVRSGLGQPPDSRSATVDAALGAAWQACTLTARSVGTVGRAVSPVTRLLADPPLVPSPLRPRVLVERSAARWREQEPAAQAAAATFRDTVLVTTVDTALGPLDLTEIVIDHVDLRRVVASTLAELDLTEIVLTQVDLARIADAVLEQVDLDATARDRMDLLGLANYVIDGIDLPEIIRESTGSVASETVRTVRMQSIEADEFVQRTVDRLRLLRKNRDRAEETS